MSLPYSSSSFLPMPPIRDMSRSWLLFMTEALNDENIPFIIEAGGGAKLSTGEDLNALQFNSGYVLLDPASAWTMDSAGGAVSSLFSIQVTTTHQPGEPLVAYERNLAIQIALSHILFGPERLLSGFSTGADDTGLLFSIPLFNFSEDASTSSLINTYGLTYTASSSGWENVSHHAPDICIWQLNIRLSISP